MANNDCIKEQLKLDAELLRTEVGDLRDELRLLYRRGQLDYDNYVRLTAFALTMSAIEFDLRDHVKVVG
jgi:hypothetical protein